MAYRRASFEPLRRTGYGVGFHWTTWTVPRKGKPLAFPDAVEQFDIAAFVQQAVATGAGHVLFPLTHELQWFPCPHPVVDRLLPGRTCQRDLIMELADALEAVNIQLVLYYHHGCDLTTQDPAWQQAVGGQDLDQTRFHDCITEVIGWIAQRYGRKFIAWWFDAGYGPMRRAAAPFARWSEAAKLGHPDRLVTYNAGIERHQLYTPCQDYWAGESIRLNFVPRGPLTPAGLPWYSYTTWHAFPDAALGGEWGMNERSVQLNWPPPPVESVVAYLQRFVDLGGTVTFNLLCYQDGSVLESDLKVMEQVKKHVR